MESTSDKGAIAEGRILIETLLALPSTTVNLNIDPEYEEEIEQSNAQTEQSVNF